LDGSISLRSEGRAAGAFAVVRRAWRPLAVAAAVLVIAGGALALTRTGAFHVRSIEVEGASHLPRREVVRLAGISLKDNAVWLDDAAAEHRLESDPWVETAEVRIDLPWTVTLTVTERSPVAIVDRGGDTTLVAGDGTNLGRVDGRADLPRIEVPPTWVDEQAGSDIDQVAAAIGAMGEELRSRIGRVTLGPAGIELLLKDGVRVVYGSAADAPAKARAISQVLEWMETSGVQVRSLSVSAPSAPAVTSGN
jgi:cell division protein FtsQ